MSVRASDRLLLGSPLRRPRVARRVAAVLLLVLLIAGSMLALVVAGFEPATLRVFALGLGLAAIASIVPVAILWYLDRRERESPWLYALAILWGALIATGIALPLNQGVFIGVARWLAENPALRDFLGPRAVLL